MRVRNLHDPFRRARSGGLARLSDRVEALAAVLLLAAGLGMVGAAVWLGNAVSADTDRRERDWMATSYATTAVTTGISVVAPDRAAQPAAVPVRWTDPGGAEHAGSVELEWPPVAGTSLAVRVGSDGTARVGEFPDPTSVGVVIGVWALVAGWVVLGLLWRVAERLVLRHNCRQWAEAWWRVEPTWSGRTEEGS